jgi:demethylmenaquinone methyltransferase / 2-methoxy-6-polyprenyl-1,4-benzoquinol methylase
MIRRAREPLAGCSVRGVNNSTTRDTQELFAPLASGYERWGNILSMGQDARWRRRMVEGLVLGQGAKVLDIAAGTGLITRQLQSNGAEVISLDQSFRMLRPAVDRGAVGVVATAEVLPFPDASFDAVTFGYLLRYVDDVTGCMSEIARVLRPGGRVGMVEFGRPRGLWRPLWWGYTRLVLPAAGLVAGRGWYRVGRFLGPSIDGFADRYPRDRLAAAWEAAGFTDVQAEPMSLGGGLVMWGGKP